MFKVNYYYFWAMKMKRNFYLILIGVGALIAGFGDGFMEEEIALMIGFVLMMFGIYKTTQSWSIGQSEERDRDLKNEDDEL